MAKKTLRCLLFFLCCQKLFSYDLYTPYFEEVAIANVKYFGQAVAEEELNMKAYVELSDAETGRIYDRAPEGSGRAKINEFFMTIVLRYTDVAQMVALATHGDISINDIIDSELPPDLLANSEPYIAHAVDRAIKVTACSSLLTYASKNDAILATEELYRILGPLEGGIERFEPRMRVLFKDSDSLSRVEIARMNNLYKRLIDEYKNNGGI
ncbi:MAG: hypothetical protein LBU16_00610 [Treponema sp.]|jgi:hypothetical protein|nr:hypothetical protein [Treponema sp.]